MAEERRTKVTNIQIGGKNRNHSELKGEFIEDIVRAAESSYAQDDRWESRAHLPGRRTMGIVREGIVKVNRIP